MSTDHFLIEFLGDVRNPRATGFCLGVESIDAGARVMLRPFAVDYEWTLDTANGIVALAHHPDLVLSFAGDKPENETPLALAMLADSDNQRWNWYAYTPRIVSSRYPTFAIDCPHCEIIANQPLWMYNTAFDCQAWKLTRVDKV
ncbi:MAG: hypothetical protein ABUT39_26075 [Acidobacteriota bacterium]